MGKRFRCITLAAFALSSTHAILAHGALTVRWGHQLLTSTKDAIFSTMTADSSNNIYIALSRGPNDTSDSAPQTYHLLKFGQNGDHLWSKQLGTSGIEDPLHVAVDGLAADDHENIYVYGHTGGSLGRTNMGKFDMFFAKYDRAGAQQWVRQLGTPEHDVCTGLDIDASQNVYITGYTYGAIAAPNKGATDIVIAAYNQAGALLWQDQIGTDVDDRALDLRLGDHNDVYLCAITSGSLSGPNHGMDDFVVARYSRAGTVHWLRQFGTDAHDRAFCVDVGQHGQVYIGGRTVGNLENARSHRGYGDAFLLRIAQTGDALWLRQFGSRGWDKTFHMAPFHDGSGDVMVGGCQYPRGICQAFCRRYAADGKLVWTKEFRKRSAIGGTCGRAVAIDHDNHCYHAGVTRADNFAKNNGTRNVFIVRFDETQEKQSSP